MNIIDLREGPRRSLITGRIDERRKVAHEFVSSEWLKYIKDNAVDCPKIDRRIAERHTEKRQYPDRREPHVAQPADAMNNHVRIFLSPAEKQLIKDLYLSEL